MALQILNAPGSSPREIARQIHEAIAAAIPSAEIDVEATSGSHFAIRVTSAAFEGKTRVAQHQLVYGAITPLMTGEQPPVHAIDRLDCLVP